MFDDDRFNVPVQYESLTVSCECGWANHSCDPNCYYENTPPYAFTALRDIQPGKELCIHYGTFDTKKTLIAGIKCQCGSEKCAGILQFNNCRDSEFQKKYFNKVMSPYVKKKVDQLRPEQKENNGVAHF